MARVTSAEVQELVPELDSDVDVTIFITTATNLVDDVLDIDDDSDGINDYGLSENRLHDIELFLAAHFTCVSHMRIAQEGVGTANESIQYAVSLNFNVTVFGQQALILDTSGKLAQLQTKTKTGGYTGPGEINWLGRRSHTHGYYT